MNGKLEYDFFKHVKCDKCGKVPIFAHPLSTPLLSNWITLQKNKRKRFFLCLECTRVISSKLLEVYLK